MTKSMMERINFLATRHNVCPPPAKRKKRPKPYHSLLAREEAGGPWAIEFGDYERAVVEDELQNYRDSGALKKNLKIITTGERQADIQAAVDALNAEA